MKDSDLVNKIAKIENLGFAFNLDSAGKDDLYSAHDGDKWFSYNPLTDDDLCIRLMEKHEVVCVVKGHIDGSKVTFNNDYEYYQDYPDKLDNRKALLAIIEANNE